MTAGLCACGGGGSGAGSSTGIDSIPPQALAEAGHALRRVGFGPTPADLEAVARNGVRWYVESQLQPETIDENSSPELAAWLALLPEPQSEADQPSLATLVERQFARAIYSPRQLVESLTQFFEAHFNTNYYTHFNYFGGDEPRAAWLESLENQRFRNGCMGRFEDLLIASATSPAMLITLDNVSNSAGNPNENYARELVELFTLGVDNGYTQHDIEELARCFTGWSVCEVAPSDVDDPLASCAAGQPGAQVAFHFDASRHDSGPKTIFAGTPHELALPARAGDLGLADGFDVLTHLARLDGTADFLCTKLARKFIADDPPRDLIDAAKAVWHASDGDLREVLRALLTSPAFLDPAHAWIKVETPFESLVSTVRALEGHATRRIELTNFRAVLEMQLHHNLFRWPDPDGYPEGGDRLLGTSRLLGRIAFHEWIYRGENDDIRFDVAGLLHRHGARKGDAASLVRTLGKLLHQDRFLADDEALAVRFLTTDADGVPRALDPDAPDYARRLKELAAFVASLPQGVLQ